MTRALDILQAVATSERPLTPAELGEILGIPKATVHRLCSVLEERRMVESRINGRGLLPGKSLYQMSLGALSSAAFTAQRHAILTALSARIGETCNISIPAGSSMRYFDRVETHWPMRIQLPVGSLVPVYCTAAGKIYLSSLSKPGQRRILESLELERFTTNTIVDVDELLDELARSGERGYAQDNEEWLDGMVALAVPLNDTQGQVYGTLSFNAPSMRINIHEAHQYLEALQSAATELDAIAT